MSDNEFPQKRYETSEALLQDLKERCDDVESVTVSVPNGMLLSGPNGERRYVAGLGALIRLVGGDSLMIHRDDLQNAINDGVFSRLRIPVHLLPVVAEEGDGDGFEPRD